MEQDLASISNSDLRLIYQNFAVVRTDEYNESPMREAFKEMFDRVDRSDEGTIDRAVFPDLARGYFNSKHK
jgi:hypothetical protein